MKTHPVSYRAGSLLIAYLACLAGWGCLGAQADPDVTPNFSHIKVMMIDFLPNQPPEQLEFIASHYDVAIGGNTGDAGVEDIPHFAYDNYYCVYVGNEQYQDMEAWAENHEVDLEEFFIHYAEETEATFADVSYVLPAGSRVPTYGWGDTEGDLTKDGARVVNNPGSSDYRAWKLDYLEARLGPDIAGVWVDNTSFDHIIKIPRAISGGLIAEYPFEDPGPAYGDDLLTLFAEFTERFPDKGQVPNVSGSPDDPRMYPYVWGIYRELTNKPHMVMSYNSMDSNIANSTAAGVTANLMGGFAVEPRYDMAMLANYYLVQNETCYFFPFLSYVAGHWQIDPRLNQWFEAVAYDVGQPKGPRYTLVRGVDPSSPDKDTMTTTDVTERSPGIYRLTDPSKSWADEQWQNDTIAFPSGYVMDAVWHSGSNWVDLYMPDEVPTEGTYELGTYTYRVLCREYDNALVLYRPYPFGSEVGDASAAEVPLPASADNPSGSYYLLNSDGSLDLTPRTSVSLRNTDGAILVKESKAAGTVALYKTVDKVEAAPGSIVTYTIQWRNTMDATAQDAVIQDVVPAGTSYVTGSAEASGGRFDGSKVIWDLGSIAPGANGSVSFQVRGD